MDTPGHSWRIGLLAAALLPLLAACGEDASVYPRFRLLGAPIVSDIIIGAATVTVDHGANVNTIVIGIDPEPFCSDCSNDAVGIASATGTRTTVPAYWFDQMNSGTYRVGVGLSDSDLPADCPQEYTQWDKNQPDDTTYTALDWSEPCGSTPAEPIAVTPSAIPLTTFTVPVAPPPNVYIETYANAAADVDAHTVVELYDGTGTTRLGYNQYRISIFSGFATSLAAGTYYVKVTSYLASSPGRYTIQVNQSGYSGGPSTGVPAAGVNEPNDTFGTAMSLTLGAESDNRLESGTDVDWFVFTVP